MEPLLEANHASLRFAAPTERRNSLKEWTLAVLSGKLRHRSFLAVDDVSFRIHRGETVGLVGRNGAGKSTLLKMVTGIARPSSGTVAVRGQVAPLLALGNGLDSALTGRENIYLNGAILGYRKEFLRDKEADIIDFSELGSFIDAPVRTYSSGMTMRLAFSIATAAVPEILILDEVLAVGDAAFQEKCKERIAEIIEEGATVFFVSHSLADIQKLCQRTIWLEKGRVILDGPSEKVCPLFADFAALPFLPLQDVLSPATNGEVPACRFRSKRYGNHLLTSFRPEMRKILAKFSGWACEGIVCRTFDVPSPGPGTVPIHRFYSRACDAHFLAAARPDGTLPPPPGPDWKFEFIVFHAFPAPSPGTIPVYELPAPSGHGFRTAIGDEELRTFLPPGTTPPPPAFYVLPA